MQHTFFYCLMVARKKAETGEKHIHNITNDMFGLVKRLAPHRFWRRAYADQRGTEKTARKRECKAYVRTRCWKVPSLSSSCWYTFLSTWIVYALCVRFGSLFHGGMQQYCAREHTHTHAGSLAHTIKMYASDSFCCLSYPKIGKDDPIINSDDGGGGGYIGNSSSEKIWEHISLGEL